MPAGLTDALLRAGHHEPRRHCCPAAALTAVQAEDRKKGLTDKAEGVAMFGLQKAMAGQSMASKPYGAVLEV